MARSEKEARELAARRYTRTMQMLAFATCWSQRLSGGSRAEDIPAEYHVFAEIAAWTPFYVSPAVQARHEQQRNTPLLTYWREKHYQEV